MILTKYFYQNIIEEQEKWYVLYTRPNFEKQATKRLKELGFLSYLPLRRELRQWNDRKSWLEAPLFRSYVFLKTTLREKDRAYNVKGILKFVRVGTKLAVLSDEEIDRIRQICLYPGDIGIEFERLKIGKSIEISSGVLMGMRGLLTEVNDHSYVRIYIDGLNCFANVKINLDTVSFKYIS